ncbi:M23 family metallopeptidase [Lysinibacillus fusiformis]|uniref:M23 family metallopeptidase n=1 Tax=Lysinibacillus fusiformis TaxID=28031 RepID=UPI000469D708|nr:M23 family metallopeptidase [Lysinibacillus fusiformis]
MTNYICPLKGNNIRLTSPFGWRTNPFGSNKVFHQGVDLARTSNTNVEVVASADGEVIRTGKLGTYGYVVMIRHTINGKLMDTNNAHLKKDSIKVKVGQKVKQGQPIAIMGSTGSSTAPHLHFEIHNGIWTTGQPNAVNPMKYISLLNSIQENGDELTMSEYNELKKLITDLQKENTELKNQLANKLDKQEAREPLKYHVDDWQWLKANNITDGSNPQNYITREQVSSILKNFEQYYTKKLS